MYDFLLTVIRYNSQLNVYHYSFTYTLLKLVNLKVGMVKLSLTKKKLLFCDGITNKGILKILKIKLCYYSFKYLMYNNINIYPNKIEQ